MNDAATTGTLEPAIQMRGLTVVSMRNQNVTVVQDVTWTVASDEFWVIGAPQHSGKSDFLMTAGGILSPAAGEYAFLGEPMPIFEESRLAHRLKLGFAFDGGQLLGSLTLAENIALPLRYHSRMGWRQIQERVAELLEATGLTAWADRSPVRVARSWLQRAGLARALALSPEVLLLDSPLTGLDMRHTSWWQRFLKALQDGHPVMQGRPLTLVATADDLRPWRQLANRVACLSGNRFVVLGDWAAVNACREELVRDLMRE